jgi:hypothetical protein
MPIGDISTEYAAIAEAPIPNPYDAPPILLDGQTDQLAAALRLERELRRILGEDQTRYDFDTTCQLPNEDSPSLPETALCIIQASQPDDPYGFGDRVLFFYSREPYGTAGGQRIYNSLSYNRRIISVSLETESNVVQRPGSRFWLDTVCEVVNEDSERMVAELRTEPASLQDVANLARVAISEACNIRRRTIFPAIWPPGARST